MSDVTGAQEAVDNNSRRSSRRLSSSTIESSVTRLLVSTKHLLESLTQWSRKEADDKYVSDAYVKLGNDFRAASRAFTNAGVDFSDIGDVPQALRIILEAALSESPSPENLDRFLPNIRNIIVTLLQNLKSKQIKARSIAIEKPRLQEKSEGTSRTSKLLSAESITRHLNSKIETPSTSLQSDSSDALSQLQSGNFLQRRASKRFSAYQYAKLTSMSPASIPTALPVLETTESTTEKEAVREKHADEPSSSPPQKVKSTKTIFLRLKDSTKKAQIHGSVTFASLRLLFVEKFAYSPGLDSFPSIYITDPSTSVAYELEEQSLVDIEEGSILTLKLPFESDLSNEELLKAINALRQVQELQYADLAAQIANLSLRPKKVNETTKESTTQPTNVLGIEEITSLKQQFTSLRLMQAQYKRDVEADISSVIAKVKAFQEGGLNVSKSSNRAYMEGCHSKLSEESDILLTKVDDLQDLMEAMRKDVAQRGVRIGEKQLKNTNREIQAAKNSLKEMSQYITRERVVWKRIWESELDKVCEEQQFFNLQGDLTVDLEHDLKKIEKTFDLIEQCSLEQSKQNAQRRNKFFVPLMEPGKSLDKMKDAILTSVVALNPDHDRRLDAITRAEKLRDRERELMRKDQFQEELEDFVGDKKFKNAVGIDEVERLRRERDSENLKSSLSVPFT